MDNVLFLLSDQKMIAESYPGICESCDGSIVPTGQTVHQINRRNETHYQPRKLHLFRIKRSSEMRRSRAVTASSTAEHDLLLWDYVLFSGKKHKTIVLLESEILANCSFLDFFEPSFKYPISGSTVRVGAQANKDWIWYQRAPALVREKFGDLVASISPISGIQMDWDLAEAMAYLVMRSNGLFDDMHPELAIGTLARMLGVDPQPMVVPEGFVPEDYISEDPKRPKVGPWGVFYPVEQLPPAMEDRGKPDAPPLTVLTLWRTGWNTAQSAVLAYLEEEEFPEGTQFLWAAAPGSDTLTKLRGLAGQDTTTSKAETVADIPAPAVGIPASLWAERRVQILEIQPSTATHRGDIVKDLMNQALLKVAADELLLIEDDVVATLSTYASLRKTWAELPPEASACMVGYISRWCNNHFCAGDIFEGYIPLRANPAESPKSVNWVGGGYTLYKSADVEACLPLNTETRHNRYLGWDVNLSERLRVGRRKVFLAYHLTADHRFRENS